MIDEIVNKSLSTNLEAKLADFDKDKETNRAMKHPRASEPQAKIENKNDLDQALETDQLVVGYDTQVESVQSDSENDANSLNSVISLKSDLTYKTLSDDFFYWTAIIQHVVSLYFAIKIKGILEISEFMGAIPSTLQFFIFPSIAYIATLSRYGTSRIREKKETIFYLVLSYVFVSLSIVVLVSYFYILFLRLTGKLHNDE